MAALGPTKIVVVDDDPIIHDVIAAFLDPTQYTFENFSCPKDALEALKTGVGGVPDLIVTDLHMPAMTGLRFIETFREFNNYTPVVMITENGSIESAVEAMKLGANNYILKPLEAKRTQLLIERALAQHHLEAEVRVTRNVLQNTGASRTLVGKSPPVLELLKLIDRLANFDVNVLIRGESGTGKDVVARSIHETSRRQKGPFLAINCAAIPEHLLESELFGYKKGAFSGANQNKNGLLVEASGGTLFLDEIGDMPHSLQSKILRALQEKRVRPVGAAKEIETDIRIISATNVPLAERIEKNQFREDLYFRLAVFPLQLPPLRERGEDVTVLANHFLNEPERPNGPYSLTTAAKEKLQSYHWPGNVRELQSVVERAIILTNGQRIDASAIILGDLQFDRSQETVASEPTKPLAQKTLKEIELEHLNRVLSETGGNKEQAARILGIDRKTLSRKVSHDPS